MSSSIKYTSDQYITALNYIVNLPIGGLFTAGKLAEDTKLDEKIASQILDDASNELPYITKTGEFYKYIKPEAEDMNSILDTIAKLASGKPKIVKIPEIKPTGKEVRSGDTRSKVKDTGPK